MFFPDDAVQVGRILDQALKARPGYARFEILTGAGFQ